MQQMGVCLASSQTHTFQFSFFISGSSSVLSGHSSRRANTTCIPEQISTPLPTTETNHTTTKLYDDVVESTYTDMKQHHSSTDRANVSHSSDTLPRKTDLECEYVQLEHPLRTHTQEDSNCNDTLPRNVDLSFDTQHQHEEDNNTDGLISTGQNVAYDERLHRNYSISLHETTPCLPDSGGYDSGSLTLTNPVITTLTTNYLHFTQSDPCLSVPEMSLTAPEVSTYHNERLTPSVLSGPELTPCILTEPGVTVTDAESESCTLSNPEITRCNPAYSEFNPSTLSYSPSEGIPLTPPRPGSPDPIYANINVTKSEVPNKSSMSNRVKELVYQFENQLLSQTEPSDAERDQEP